MSQTFQCPKCKNSIDIENILKQQMEVEFQQKLDAVKIELDKSKKIDLENGIKLEREKLIIDLNDKYLSQINNQKKMNEQLTNETIKLKNIELINEELKQKMQLQEQDIALKLQKEFNEKFQKQMEQVEKNAIERLQIKTIEEQEKNSLMLRERDKTITQYKDQIETMNKKINQGSMQLQGEVQELIIEEFINKTYPLDIVTPVQKGKLGADCVHSVRDKTNSECGKIIYESKRTKAWNKDWIEKLKLDNASVKADLMVIITETLPNDIDRAGFVEGVWVCTFIDFKPMLALFRNQLIQVQASKTTQANKGDKMVMLYDYLTSNEFKIQIEGMLSGYKQLKKSYEDEKAFMQRLWKKREKELEQIMMFGNEFIGAVQGIGGSKMMHLDNEKTDNWLEE